MTEQFKSVHFAPVAHWILILQKINDNGSVLPRAAYRLGFVQ